MKRSPGPTPCSPLRTSSAASDSASSGSTRCCMRSVSASRGRCTPGQVDEHELRVARCGHAADRPARGLRLVGDDRHLAPDHPVDERRLADVRAPGERDEARAGDRRRYHVSSSAWSASISPSSVSWSMPVRCSAPWTTASRRSSVCAGQMTMSPSSRGPARAARRRRPGRRARRSARACRGTRALSDAMRSASTNSTATWPVVDAGRGEGDADQALDLGAAAALRRRRRR